MRRPLVAALIPALGAGGLAHCQGTVISVKVVKASAGRCTAPATLEFLARREGWKVLTGEAFQGENDWEVYWNLEHAAPQPPLPRLRASCPDVKIARIIVGRTDVPFEVVEGAVEFDLVRDTARGQLIQTVLTDPMGGLAIDLHHNWEMRRAGRYREGEWPAARIAAHNNYLFAAREALKLMGPLGRADGKPLFDGRIVLEGFETAFTRGHEDYPPHFHVMLYPPGYTGAQVPHFYMDEAGNVTRNSFVAIGVAGSGRDFGPGEWCSLRDLQGVLALELMIREDGGLSMRLGPDHEELILRGLPPDGPAKSVGVYRKDNLLLTVSVTDDAAEGRMAVRIESRTDRAPSVHERVEYDPFIGHLRARTPL